MIGGEWYNFDAVALRCLMDAMKWRIATKSKKEAQPFLNGRASNQTPNQLFGLVKC